MQLHLVADLEFFMESVKVKFLYSVYSILMKTPFFSPKN